MKKTVVAILLSGICAASVQAAGQDNTWYAGAKAGWSNFYGVDYANTVKDNFSVTDEKNDDFGTGAFVGYQLNQNVGFELGYDWLGQFKYQLDNVSDDYRVRSQLAQLTMKLGLPVSPSWDLYTRLGGAYAWTANRDIHQHYNGGAFVAALGAEYAIDRDWAARLEYQYTTPLGKDRDDDTQVQFDNGLLSLGILYRFGQAAPVVAAPLPAPAPAPQVVDKQFTLSADVLFDFNKHTLKPEGYTALDSLYEQLKAERPKDGTATVIGYTDRLGADAYNQSLSEKRAQSVASYLVSKGLPADKVAVEGRGKASPVTGESCTSRNRKELIVCLAPDRRVEVHVQGVAEAQQ